MKIKMGIKKCAAIALAACVLSSAVLTGCGEQSGQIFLYEPGTEEKDVTVSMVGYKADTLNLLAIEETLHGFMDQNSGINITYEGLKGSTYWSALEKRASTGTLDDIFMIDHDRMQEYSSQGLLADLSEVPGLNSYNALAKSQFADGSGQVWFLPTCIAAYGLYVNRDVLEADGQTVPTNWGEFAAVCDYYVGKGSTPIIVNNSSSIRSMIVGRGMFDVYQSQDPEAEIDALNSGKKDLTEQLAPGLEIAFEMISRKWVDCSEALETSQTNGDLELFDGGERPFMITGAWASPRVKDMDPGFEYSVYPLPVLEDGGVLVADVATCLAVNAESQHLEKAKDFLAYVIQPDEMWSYCDSQSSYTPLNDNRTPTDSAVAPSVECWGSGRIVIGADYRLEFPIDTALNECVTALLSGESLRDVENLLREQLNQNKDQ